MDACCFSALALASVTRSCARILRDTTRRHDVARVPFCRSIVGGMRGLFENTALPTAPPIGRQYLANAESTSPFSDALSLYTFVFVKPQWGGCQVHRGQSSGHPSERPGLVQALSGRPHWTSPVRPRLSWPLLREVARVVCRASNSEESVTASMHACPSLLLVKTTMCKAKKITRQTLCVCVCNDRSHSSDTLGRSPVCSVSNSWRRLAIQNGHT